MARVLPLGKSLPCRSLFSRIFLIACLTLAAPGASKAERVQLELVLAVDVSLSVSATEFDLQVQGLAAAFRDEAVITAIRAAGDNGIAVTLLQWSDNNQQKIAVDWTRIITRADASGFAARIEAAPRLFPGDGTAITRALESSIAMFGRGNYVGDRKVIDLSGDGVDNRGPTPQIWRDVAVSYGITVNGLAILNEEDNLDLYYIENVIGGTGAFVMVAKDYHDFAPAILRKLIREISAAPVAQRQEPTLGPHLAQNPAQSPSREAGKGLAPTAGGEEDSR